CRLFDELDQVRLDLDLAYDLANYSLLIRRAANRCASLFAGYGLDLNTLDPVRAAARINVHPHRERLLDEIDTWGMLLAKVNGANLPRITRGPRGILLIVSEWAKAERLLGVLDAVDADPAAFRRRWRSARAKEDAARLAELSRSPEALAASSLGISN